MTVMSTTHGDVISQYPVPEDCVEDTLDGQTDSHSEYSAQMRVLQMAIPNL